MHHLADHCWGAWEQLFHSGLHGEDDRLPFRVREPRCQLDGFPCDDAFVCHGIHPSEGPRKARLWNVQRRRRQRVQGGVLHTEPQPVPDGRDNMHHPHGQCPCIIVHETRGREGQGADSYEAHA